MRKFIAILLIAMTFLTIPTFGETVSLEEVFIDETSYQTRFSSIHDMRGVITKESGYLDIEALLHASEGDNTRLTGSLQKYNNGLWTTIKTFNNYSSDTICYIDEKVYVSTKYDYRLKLQAYVYMGSSLLESATLTIY